MDNRMQKLTKQPKPPKGVAQNTNLIVEACNLVGNALSSQDSTIYVRQYKTKWNEIRVYCDLASDLRVTECWQHTNPNAYVLEYPNEDFFRKCLIRDCQHYRNVYHSAMKAIPSSWSSLYGGADWKGLLAETREGLDELLDSQYYSGVPMELDKDRYNLYKILGL